MYKSPVLVSLFTYIYYILQLMFSRYKNVHKWRMMCDNLEGNPLLLYVIINASRIWD